MKWFVVSVAVGLLLIGCGNSPQTQAPTASEPCNFESIQQAARRFDDAEKLAIAVPRDQLPDQIENIQAVRREAEDLDVEPCASEARAALVAYIDANINMMLAFLDASSWDETQAHWIGEVFEAREEYIAAMTEWDQDPGLTIPALLLTPTASNPDA